MTTDRNKATVADRPSGARSSQPPTSVPPTCAFDPPEEPAERYAERAELGRGGMGRVAEAVDVALGRRVAVKHVLTDDPVAIARFEREARITARLEHPSIVPLYDAGRTPEGTPFYVMRKVDGRPLEQLVEEGITSEALIPNVLAACDAVAYAHARGIIHRDIKPPNILVGAYGETLLIDWGLARMIDEADVDPGGSHALVIGDPDLTRAGTIAGTPGFMAPEQARGEPTDARADVFALGATLFYILARRPPYASAASGTEMIGQVAAERPPEWEAIPRETRRDLRAIVMKAMAGRPEDRYADASELAADLRRFITGNLVGAHDYGRLERLRRYVARHRAAVSIASISLVILAVVATVAVRRVLAERDDANAARALAEQRREEALDQADEQLVRRAHAELARDPLSAIGQLRTLRPGSRKWRDAAVVLEGARVRGVPFGFTLPGFAQRPEISRTSPRAMVLLRDGTLGLIDLAHRTLHVAGGGGADQVSQAHWYRDTIAHLTDSTITFRDGSTGVALRTLAMPEGAITWFQGDNGEQLWCVANRTAYRLVDQGTRWERMFDDVTNLFPSTTFDRIAIIHSTTYSVWLGTHEKEIEIGKSADLYDKRVALAGDRVLVRTSATTHVLIGLDPETEAAHVLRTLELDYVRLTGTLGETLVAIANTSIYAIDVNGARARTAYTYEQLVHTDHGGIAVRTDGSIEIQDARGRFTIAPTKLRYRQLSMSADGRFVIASAAGSNTVIAWDLSEFRTSVPLALTESLVRLTPGTLWTIRIDELLRHDLPAGGGRVYPDLPMVSELVASADDRFVIVSSPMVGVTVIDQAANERFSLTEVETFNITTEGVIYETHDRVVHVIDAVSPKGRVITTLPEVASRLLYDPTARRIVALVPRALGVFDLTTQTYTKIPLAGEPENAAIANGTIWAIVDGALVVVDDGVARPVTVPHPCVRIGVAPSRTLAWCKGALFSTVAGRPSTDMVAIVDEVLAWSLGDDLVAFARARGQVSALHISSELPIELPIENHVEQGLQGLHVEQHRLGYQVDGQTKSVVLFDIQPATSEAELSTRLARITNAVTHAESAAMTWPDR